MSEHAASIAFDRAPEYYDRTRAMSPEAIEATVRLLVSELSAPGACLEIGVGTGRVALPLHDAGIEMVGVDLARPMLDKLVAKAGGRAPFPLVVADAAMLPFVDASFGGAIACHVLHLVPAWRRVLEGLVRAVRPGGVILVQQGWRHDWWGEVAERFSRAAGTWPPFVGVTEIREVDRAMERLGASSRRLAEVHDARETSVSAALAALEQGIYSFTWSASPEARARASEDVRRWAEERFDDLDEVRRDRVPMTWHAYDLP